MKITNPIAFALFACAALQCALFADTITLNSGEKVEGKILSDTGSEVTIEVKVGASITDERVIQKSDIKENGIEKATEDDLAFNEIKGIQINPKNSLAPETYDAALGRLKEFAEKYPLSQHLAAVKETQTAFEAEQKRVQAGEIKVLGKWLTKDEAAKEKYQIQAQVLFATMEDAARRGDNTGALNAFDQMERTYPGAAVYPDAVTLARQVLAAFARQVANSEQMLKIQKQQLDQTLAATPEPRKSELIRRMSSQTAADSAAFDAAKGKWKILIPRSEKSVLGIKQMIQGEMTRLAALPVQKMRESIAASNAAMQALDGKKYDEAEASIKKATMLWAQNETATRLTREITDAKAAADKEATAKTAAAAKAAQIAEQKKQLEQDKTKKEEATPFYMTLKGALTILGGLIVVIVIGSIVSKVSQSRSAKKEDEE